MLKNYQLHNLIPAVTLFLAGVLLQGKLRLLLHIIGWNCRNFAGTIHERRKIQGRRLVRDSKLFSSGLLSRRPLHPGPQPEVPDDRKKKLLLCVNHRCVPAFDTTEARLGYGWHRTLKTAKDGKLRAISGRAACRMRVGNNACGLLKVSARYTGPADRKDIPFRVVCNAAYVDATLSTGRESIVELDVASTRDGLLTIELLADEAYSDLPSGRKSKSCIIEKIEFHPAPEQPLLPINQTVSVVIPAYNRPESLIRVVDALTTQTVLPCEVIIIDDGSEVCIDQLIGAHTADKALPFRLETLRQSNAGPAVARNRGVSMAKGELVAFLGDDTIPHATWLEKHLEMHAEYGPGAAVVGYTHWDTKDMRVTPFLRFANEYGIQFCYSRMKDTSEVPLNCLYTSNISLKRSFLEIEKFNEEFTSAAWEDTEISYRLRNRGVSLIFCREAKVAHLHPSSFKSFLNRQYAVGEIWAETQKTHPELSEICRLRDSRSLRKCLILARAGVIFAPLISLIDYLCIPLPRPLYSCFMYWKMAEGFVRERDAIKLAQDEKPCNAEPQ